jgi:post-segregation antitoxin (ccd killing protein)
MTITVEIKPQVEAELAAQAAARGLDVPAYVTTLIERAAQTEHHSPEARNAATVDPVIDRSTRPKHQRPPGRKSLAQLFAESPFKGLELDFERDRDTGRDIEL